MVKSNFEFGTALSDWHIGYGSVASNFGVGTLERGMRIGVALFNNLNTARAHAIVGNFECLLGSGGLAILERLRGLGLHNCPLCFRGLLA